MTLTQLHVQVVASVYSWIV